MSPFGKIRVGSAKGTGPRTLPCCAISRSISCAKSPARRACPASASPVLWIPSTCSRYCWESNFNALALLVEGINQTHAVSAMARLLAPARFALGAPVIGTGFIVIHPGLIKIHQLLGGHLSQLCAKLFSQLFVPLGVAKSLFLCV